MRISPSFSETRQPKIRLASFKRLPIFELLQPGGQEDLEETTGSHYHEQTSLKSIKNWMGPSQRTPKYFARAIGYPGLGVRSVGPVRDFLDTSDGDVLGGSSQLVGSNPHL